MRGDSHGITKRYYTAINKACYGVRILSYIFTGNERVNNVDFTLRPI